MTIKPYRIVTISVYEDDLTRWNVIIEDLKRRGYTTASRSSLLRYAMRQLDVEEIPSPPPSGDLDDVHGSGIRACPNCKHCFRYALQRITVHVCPECGQEFDA